MKCKNLLIKSFIVLSIIANLAGCASTSAGDKSVSGNTPAVINKETVDFYPDSTNVKILGRGFYDGNLLFMGYSSTGAEFNIKAKRLDVTIAGDSQATSSAARNSSARVMVFVNNEAKLDEMITKSTQTFTVFDQKELVEGVVQIVKVSECSSSYAGLEKITLDKNGSISPTASKNLKIEFIGDSITCGYGVEDLNRNNHFKTSTENNTKTYAYKTAKNLDADYSMVSVSGWGIVSGYTGNGTKSSWGVLPKVYDKLGVSCGSTLDGINAGSVSWKFNSFIPDVVVINLGTNDASYTKNIPDRVDEYKTEYIKFIKDIRAKNPDAHIICSLGVMGQDLYPAIVNAVTEYKSETGDEKVYSLKFDNQNAADGIAADWHPSEATHTKAGLKLTLKIKEILGI